MDKMKGEMKNKEYKMKIVEEGYRDALNIFGKKLSENEKNILIEKMKKRTKFNLSFCNSLISVSSLALLSLAGYNILHYGISYESILCVAVAATAIYSIATCTKACGRYIPKPFHLILLSKNPSKSEAFHEAIHFLADENVIKMNVMNEKIPTAASLLYKCIKYDIDANEAIEYTTEYMNKKNPFNKIMFRSHDNGYKLCKELLIKTGNAKVAMEKLAEFVL